MSPPRLNPQRLQDATDFLAKHNINHSFQNSPQCLLSLASVHWQAKAYSLIDTLFKGSKLIVQHFYCPCESWDGQSQMCSCGKQAMRWCRIKILPHYCHGWDLDVVTVLDGFYPTKNKHFRS